MQYSYLDGLPAVQSGLKLEKEPLHLHLHQWVGFFFALSAATLDEIPCEKATSSHL